MIKIKQITPENQLIEVEIDTGGYFSITGTHYYTSVVSNRLECSGCIHETILEYFPQFKPIVDLHLCDLDGKPMHVYENAFYWAGLTSYGAADADTLASHLRIDKGVAETLIQECSKLMVEGMKPNDPMSNVQEAKDHLKEFIDSQLPRYLSEAAKVRKYIASLNL